MIIGVRLGLRQPCDVTIRRLPSVCGLEAVLVATGQPFALIEAESAAAATALEAPGDAA
jgi:hypothetical protein